LKVLLVFINNEYRPMVPINLNMIEGYIKERGHTVKVFDASFYEDVMNIQKAKTHVKIGTFTSIDYSRVGVKIKKVPVVEDMVKMISGFMPEFIGFSVYSFTENIADNMSKAIKEKFPGIPVLWGGTHPTIVPEATISKEWVDMVCVGEGEKALLDLCTKMEAGESTENTRNIWQKKNGEIIKNPVGPLIDPNELPSPNFDSYASYHQYGPVEGVIYKLGLVEYNRGCPYSCAYCESPTIKKIYSTTGFKKFLRYKEPNKFVEDCENLVSKYGIEFFYITDGTFLVMPDKVLEELAILYSKRVKKPFMCLTTVPTITENRVKLLKKMGCFQVNMGIEAGNEEYRKKVLNRPKMSNEKIVKSFKLIKESGIRVSAYSIIGIPWQNRQGVFETIELNRAIQPDRTHLSIYIPYEGTQLRDRLLREGFVDDYTKLGDDTLCTVKVPSDMSEEEILGLQRTFNLYCRVPKELFPLLKACETDNEKTSFVMEELRKIYLAKKEES